jgi:hypothetical protein
MSLSHSQTTPQYAQSSTIFVQITMVMPLSSELTFQARITSSSKAINRMKINLRKVSQTFGDDFNRVLGCTTPAHSFEVSWPTEVVKIIERGETIDRPLEIINPHERSQAHQSNGDGISWPQGVIRNRGLPQEEQLSVLNTPTRDAGTMVKLVSPSEADVSAAPLDQSMQDNRPAHPAPVLGCP